MSTDTSTSSVNLDERLLGDILSAEYTRAVVVTDKKGEVVSSRIGNHESTWNAVDFDMMLASVARCGSPMDFGQLNITAALYDNGTLVAGSNENNNVLIVASSGANLGQLFNQIRRVFS